MKRLEILDLAQRDFDEAVDWYEERQEGRGDKFADEVNEYLAKIQQTPGRFHFAANSVRRANLKVHPFNILFRMIPGGVRITAIRQNKRHPSYGIGRK